MTPEPHSRSSTVDPEEALTANGGLFSYQPSDLLCFDESVDARMSDVSGEGDLSGLSDREAEVVCPLGVELAEGAVLDRLDATGESVVAVEKESSQQVSSERVLSTEHVQKRQANLLSTEHTQKDTTDLFAEIAQESSQSTSDGAPDFGFTDCEAVSSTELQDTVLLVAAVSAPNSARENEMAAQNDCGSEISSSSLNVAMDTEHAQVTTNQDLLPRQTEGVVAVTDQTEHAQALIAEQYQIETDHPLTLSTEKSLAVTEHVQSLDTEETDQMMAHNGIPFTVDVAAVVAKSSLEPQRTSNKSATSMTADLSGSVETTQLLVTAETGERGTPPSSSSVDPQVDLLTEHGT